MSLTAAYGGAKWSPRLTPLRDELPEYWGDWGSGSEHGKLHAVLLKRPGPELDNITDYDAVISARLAHVLCGGDLSAPQWVSEQYLLDLEREVFVGLLKEQRTLDRIQHMLKTGKPLRN